MLKIQIIIIYCDLYGQFNTHMYSWKAQSFLKVCEPQYVSISRNLFAIHVSSESWPQTRCMEN